MKKIGYIGALEKKPDISYKLASDLIHWNEQEVKLSSICQELIEDKSVLTKKSMNIDKLINELDHNDTIVICNLVYLANNLETLLNRLKNIEDRGINLEILNINEDSLYSHARAIREFSRFHKGLRISKKINKQNFVKRKNLVASHNRSAVKDWRDQHTIKAAFVKGEKTVIELAKSYNVSRQTIYRILNKEELKHVIEHLPINYQMWNLEECKERVRVNTKEVENNETLVTVTLGHYFRIDSWCIKTGSKAVSKIRTEFLEKTDDELKEIFYNLTKGKNL
ncbi:helix-turn-helix domain-containing protein [Thalassotalea hakodatensis]|uniref:helix-turn-helix domain-containing protein n=1 Tax=Thalassotalea hakodatensis TaxID=3030492 RepID=UPI002573A6F4|nr:helix-turn-helix domain-containing protein [Thalassotalea hakodatensis]